MNDFIDETFDEDTIDHTLDQQEEELIENTQKRSRRKKRAMPEGLNQIQQWMFKKEFEIGELQALTHIPREKLEQLVINPEISNDYEKDRIRLITGIKF